MTKETIDQREPRLRRLPPTKIEIISHAIIGLIDETSNVVTYISVEPVDTAELVNKIDALTQESEEAKRITAVTFLRKRRTSVPAWNKWNFSSHRYIPFTPRKLSLYRQNISYQNP